MKTVQAKKLTRKELVEKGTSIGAIQMRGVLAGKTREAILADVKKKYPKAETSAACVNYYRSALRKAGWKVPDVRPAKKEKKAKVKGATKSAAKSPDYATPRGIAGRKAAAA
jgi:hypothetical protein